jgi:hypothetical protein
MEEPQALIYLAFEPLMPNPTANSGFMVSKSAKGWACMQKVKPNNTKVNSAFYLFF